MEVEPPEDRSLAATPSTRNQSISGTAYLGTHEDDAARRERHRLKRERRDRHRPDGGRHRDRGHGDGRREDISHRETAYESSKGGGSFNPDRASEVRVQFRSTLAPPTCATSRVIRRFGGGCNAAPIIRATAQQRALYRGEVLRDPECARELPSAVGGPQQWHGVQLGVRNLLPAPI